MSSMFRCKRLHFLSLYRRNDGHCATNLHLLLRNFFFITTRPLSSVEEGKTCDKKKLEEYRHSFVVSYLENSCGLSAESAESKSRYVKFDSPEKPDSVLSLLKNYGFTCDQITKVVKSFPAVLSTNAERILLPKFEFLSSIGFSDSDIAKVVSSNPRILAVSLNNHLIPSYDFLKSILGRDELVMKSIKRSSRIFLAGVKNNLAAKVYFLREVGVTDPCVAKLMEYCPMTFCLSSAKFKEALEKVINMGFSPSSGMFVSAFRAVIQIQKSTWDRKVEVYKEWGWSDYDFSSAFKKQPLCMSISEKKIMRAMGFFVNKMGLHSSDIARNPVLLFFNLGKRTIPRCSVMTILFSKGILRREGLSYISALTMSEKSFLERFVSKYPEHVLELWNNFQEKAVPKLGFVDEDVDSSIRKQ